MDDFLTNHPEIRMLTTAVADLNGQARGKRLPVTLTNLPFHTPRYKR